MTWGEFKASIEGQDVEDDDEILWINFDSWEPVVKRNKMGDVTIS